MMTLEEKIEVIKAFSEGKLVEIYTIHGRWETKVNDVWDFKKCIYRIKPQFKIGDKLVDKRADGEENPCRFELTSITNEGAKLDDCWDCTIEELYKYYTFVDDVLWYFEHYDCTAQTWRRLTDRRFTISEVKDKFESNYNKNTLRPMYALGFALNENK
nr:MAG TPA: hypothetical protein [Caudoviricetes sp.]